MSREVEDACTYVGGGYSSCSHINEYRCSITPDYYSSWNSSECPDVYRCKGYSDYVKSSFDCYSPCHPNLSNPCGGQVISYQVSEPQYTYKKIPALTHKESRKDYKPEIILVHRCRIINLNDTSYSNSSIDETSCEEFKLIDGKKLSAK